MMFIATALAAQLMLAGELTLAELNSRESEITVAVSRDLDEIWIERRPGPWGSDESRSRLLYSRFRSSAGQWTEPMRPSFASREHGEGDPFFDEANETLYFVSERTRGAPPASGANIWRVRRSGREWLAPEALPAPVNGPGNEYRPIVRGNRLYFASDRDGGGELYVAERTDAGWNTAKLGPAINSVHGEWNLWISESRDLVVFESSGRETNLSVSGDLYASGTDVDGDWLPAVPLHEVNGTGSELNATIFEDRLVYASNSGHRRRSDLYSAPAEVVESALDRHWRYRLHVVNRSNHDLVSIDLRRGRVDTRVPIGPGPHLVSAFDRTVAVAAYGVFPRPHEDPVEAMPGWIEEPGGALLILDETETRLQLRCNRPHGTAWDDRGYRLWITCEDRHAVIEIDFRDDPNTFRRIATGHPGAHVIEWDADRDQLVVAHTAAGGVAFVEPESGTVEFLEIAPGTEALWVDRERAEAWVTIGPANRLAVIDLHDRAELARVDPGCGFPIDIAAESSSRIWLACLGTRDIVALDPATRTVIDRIGLPAGPLNVETHPDLPVIYATLPRQNRVVEISIPGKGITRSFAVGMEPDGLAITRVAGGARH